MSNDSPAKKLKREQKKAEREKLEKLFELHLKADNLTGWEKQYRFIDERKFMFDFAFPKQKIAVEIDGGTWMGKGGHNSGSGIQNDRDKDELAILNGWTVYRCTAHMVKAGRAIETVKTLLSIQKGTM